MRSEWDGLLGELLDEHVQRHSPSLEGLDEVQRLEVESLFDVADLLWEGAHGAPPLEVDPVAAMLGLVPENWSPQ